MGLNGSQPACSNEVSGTQWVTRAPNSADSPWRRRVERLVRAVRLGTVVARPQARWPGPKRSRSTVPSVGIKLRTSIDSKAGARVHSGIQQRSGSAPVGGASSWVGADSRLSRCVASTSRRCCDGSVSGTLGVRRDIRVLIKETRGSVLNRRSRRNHLDWDENVNCSPVKAK